MRVIHRFNNEDDDLRIRRAKSWAILCHQGVHLLAGLFVQGSNKDVCLPTLLAALNTLIRAHCDGVLIAEQSTKLVPARK